MTQERIKECIKLLETDGINSKEKVRAILQAELDNEDTLEQQYIDDIKELEVTDLC
jgi:uncharacterized protein YnzC (UPF0291/DUF896 family)